MKYVTAAIAPVRPRIRTLYDVSPRLLEEVLYELLEEHPEGILWLSGRVGAGKTTALAHLAAVFQTNHRIQFIDELKLCEKKSLDAGILVIAASPTPISDQRFQLKLEPWREDELIEYLLSVHRDQCGKIMQRLGTASRRVWNPELASVVLDQFADNPTLNDVNLALMEYVRNKLPDKSAFSIVCQLSLAYLRGGGESLLSLSPSVQTLPQDVKKLLRHDMIQIPFAAEHITQALLIQADFSHADLTQAYLQGANLTDARLLAAVLDEVDLRQSNLSKVDARNVDLRSAQLEGAQAENAQFTGANLENISWPNAKLYGAILHAAHLTGSCMPSADLRDADLSEARLGEINWQAADLRQANLHGATFHMGSSRSGLVGSPIASEGSRTGFYTDELEELYFKAPEEVRKANLRGADLRGANIESVDFYLVDLRDAKLDQIQRLQASSSGAILSENP